MTSDRFGYVLFYTSAAAFRAEKLALTALIPGARLVPTPRELSSDCGVALRFVSAPAAVERLLRDADIPFEKVVAE